MNDIQTKEFFKLLVEYVADLTEEVIRMMPNHASSKAPPDAQIREMHRKLASVRVAPSRLQ